MAFQTSAVTVLLYYFTYLQESNLKFRFLNLLCTNITVKMTCCSVMIMEKNGASHSC